MKKDYNEFYNSLLYMAKKNKREKEFEEGVTGNEEYKKCLEQLKSYTLSEKKQILETENNLNEKNDDDKNLEKNEKFQDKKPDELLNIKENTSNRSNNREIKEDLKSSQNNLIQVKDNKKIKGNLLQLFKYSSVRYIAIILSIDRFCNATLFYGLVIEIKTLKGSQYMIFALII